MPTREEAERRRKAFLDARRPSREAQGYDKHWRAVRNAYAAKHPICCVPGCGAVTREVDHILSVKERPDLRLAWSNLRAMCKPCHSRRTALDQGFAKR